MTEKPESAVARPMKIYAAFISRSLVVYRLVHPPVTRESGVRLPAREASFFTFFLRITWLPRYGLPCRLNPRHTPPIRGPSKGVGTPFTVHLSSSAMVLLWTINYITPSCFTVGGEGFRLSRTLNSRRYKFRLGRVCLILSVVSFACSLYDEPDWAVYVHGNQISARPFVILQSPRRVDTTSVVSITPFSSTIPMYPGR